MSEITQEFSRSNLPTASAAWVAYRKTLSTRMLRIDGPFVVETPHGRAWCEDGYLAIDANGDPYPISVDEHRRTYVADIKTTRHEDWEKFEGHG